MCILIGNKTMPEFEAVGYKTNAFFTGLLAALSDGSYFLIGNNNSSAGNNYLITARGSIYRESFFTYRMYS